MSKKGFKHSGKYSGRKHTLGRLMAYHTTPCGSICPDDLSMVCALANGHDEFYHKTKDGEMWITTTVDHGSLLQSTIPPRDARCRWCGHLISYSDDESQWLDSTNFTHFCIGAKDHKNRHSPEWL